MIDIEGTAQRAPPIGGAAIPTLEPSSFVLFASGIAAIGMIRRRRND